MRTSETKRRLRAAALGLLALAAVGCGGTDAPPESAKSESEGGLPLLFEAPTGWIEQTPNSQMRAAQYRVPRAEGDTENGEFVVFFFGGEGGGTEANIQRWAQQVRSADGAAAEPQISSEEINGLKVTTLDSRGTYDSGSSMGAPSRPKEGYRLLASVVETPAGHYFLRLTGPEATVDRWSASYDEMLKGLSYRP